MSPYRLALLLVSMTLLAPASAQAHWCDDVWASNYNLVIRPVTDSVTVPSSGSATLDIYVQNNMGYPLYNFDLKAVATGYTVKVARQAPKVAKFLMPGEKLKHMLTISKSGGGTVSVTDLSFSVTFGTGNQSNKYPSSSGKVAMIRKTDGTLFPNLPPPGMTSNRIRDGVLTAAPLLFSSQADYGDLDSALDSLMKQYCVGRPGWDHNNYTGPTTNCSDVKDASTYKCAASTSSTNGTWLDWVRLWPAAELGYRKQQLGARLAPFRKGLQCGWNDPNFAFKAFAGFVLGYLGEDAGARSFLEGIVSSGTADEKSVAMAALLMMGSSSETSKYHTDVVSCASSSNVYAAAACQASLAIVDKDDDIVSSKLLPKISWSQPDTSNGNGIFQAHLVSLVAWERRKWAPKAGDTGQVCFYEDCSGSSSGGSSSGGSSSGGSSSGGSSSGGSSSGGTSSGGSDTTPPAAPSHLTCSGTTDGGLRVAWSSVTLDEKGQSENSVSYKVYYGNSARPANATTIKDFSYTHSDSATALSKGYAGMDGSRTYYFSVVALDPAGNVSKYSNEVSCVPGAGSGDSGGGPNCELATVTPASGRLPLTVKLDASKCTPKNGISFSWKIPMSWVRVQDETTFGTATAEYTFPAEAGARKVTIDLFATANGQEQSYQFPVDLLPADSKSGTSGVGCSMGASALLPACGALALLPLLRRRRSLLAPRQDSGES